MDHLIRSESLGEVAADGTSVLVVYDYNTARSHPVPDKVRAAIEAIEGRSSPTSGCSNKPTTPLAGGSAGGVVSSTGTTVDFSVGRREGEPCVGSDQLRFFHQVQRRPPGGRRSWAPGWSP